MRTPSIVARRWRRTAARTRVRRCSAIPRSARACAGVDPVHGGEHGRQHQEEQPHEDDYYPALKRRKATAGLVALVVGGVVVGRSRPASVRVGPIANSTRVSPPADSVTGRRVLSTPSFSRGCQTRTSTSPAGRLLRLRLRRGPRFCRSTAFRARRCSRSSSRG